MTQNVSSAVMQQRLDRDPDALDDFPTPPWATRALFEHVIKPLGLPMTSPVGLSLSRVWEPAANRGYMVRALTDYFDRLTITDIADYDLDFCGKADFLAPLETPNSITLNTLPLWVVTNPPFVKAHEFIDRAQKLPQWRGTAMFVRMAFLEGLSGRYERLFKFNPPTIIAAFSERVVLHQGVLRDPDVRYLDAATGKMKKPSTATAYVWLVWIRGIAPRAPIWIPPCRKSLTREGDYPVLIEGA